MDKRDLAASNRWWNAIDKGRMRARVDNDVEVELWVPIRFEICESCGGRGRYVNPDIDRNGLTGEDFDEMGEDFREDYFSGTYDVTCGECGGDRVVPVYSGESRLVAQEIERLVSERHAYDYERESEMRYMYGPNY
jgi:hypothetical protein